MEAFSHSSDHVEFTVPLVIANHMGQMVGVQPQSSKAREYSASFPVSDRHLSQAVTILYIHMKNTNLTDFVIF